MAALKKLVNMFAPAAKVRFPPILTKSAFGPLLTFVTISNAALQPAKADIGATPQHF